MNILFNIKIDFIPACVITQVLLPFFLIEEVIWL